jgi:hypothetical protein
MRVLTTASGFKTSLTKAYQAVFQRKLAKITREVESELGTKVGLWVYESPEIQELVKGGRLWGELGIPYEILDNAISDIVSLSKQSVKLTVFKKPFSVASISITVYRDNFASFLSLPSGKYFTKKGVEIPWLKSLLIDGSKIIVKDYSFYEVPEKGRTGLGLMYKGKSNFWRVPPEYSGTVQSNFLTRAIDRHEQEITESILEKLNA